MSLNGLDVSAVTEAHQLALADPGGWFLLKYVNRDTVEVLSRGTGGVAEVKIAVEQYEEKSPLYGLLHYRRKRVVLKYVPDGTSRLLQVRLTVQFQSVLDAFSHDTVFSFTSPSELLDSALGLSTMLQPSAHSGTITPSNSSGRHHRLNEIREDGEEGTPSVQDRTVATTPVTPREDNVPSQPNHDDLSALPASAVKAKALLAKRKEAAAAAAVAAAAAAALAEAEAEAEAATLAAATAAAATAAAAAESVTGPMTEPVNLSTTPLPRSSSPIRRPLTAHSSIHDRSRPVTPQSTPARVRRAASRSREETFTPPLPPEFEIQSTNERSVSRAHHTPHLAETESHSISQWNEQVAAYAEPIPKQKKKLGPRPHVDAPTRSRASNNVAILPQSVRASNRSTLNLTGRPDSRQSSKSVPTRFVLGDEPLPPLPSSNLPALFKSSEYKRSPSIASSAVTEFSSASPEKFRLMKALQLRKRNVLLAQRAASVQSARDQPSYGDDFHSRNVSEASSRPSEAPSTSVTTNIQVARISAEHKSDVHSSTASPTSATTASADHSTNPSSFSGEHDGSLPRRSMSLDTNSSSTPKAGTEREQQSKVQSILKNDITDREYTAEKERVDPPVSEADASPQSKRVVTPPGPQTVIEQPTPKVLIQDTTPMSSPVKSGSARQKSAELVPLLTPQSEASSGSKDKNKRRRAFGSPRIPPSAEVSDGSDDESFMEELRNATVMEAKPVSVARNTVSPTMRKLSVDKIRDMTRVQTTSTHKSAKSTSSEAEKSRSGSLRSMSTALPHWPPLNGDGSPTVPLTKKASLGSGISKRIKALEVLTNRESVQSPSPPSPRDTSITRSNFTNLMNRSSFISQFQTPNMSTDRSPPKRLPTAKSAPDTSTKLDSGPRPLVQRQGQATEVFLPSRKGETISVTARIVREQARPGTSMSQTHNDPMHSMHRSPLIVEHESHESEGLGQTLSRELSGMSFEPAQSPRSERHRFSISSHRSSSTAKQQGDGRTSRMSTTNRERKGGKAASDTSSMTDGGRSSRAGRLMQRVSGFGSRLGRGRKPLSPSKDQPPVATIMEHSDSRESMSESLLQVVDIGDVNVQFPETLLWKRRSMRIDDQGFLIFSPPTDNSHIRMSNRKFHLSELRKPNLPDQEREEMSWSICIDLKDGTCIQCACESKYAQDHILKMLLDAHDAYNTLYTNYT